MKWLWTRWEIRLRKTKKKTRTHIRSSHYGIYLMWILDFAGYDLFFHLIQIYVLDSKLSRGILGVIDLLLTSMRSITAREDLVWGGLVFVHFFYNNVLLVFNEKLISLCNCHFIDSTQLLIPIVLPFTQILTFMVKCYMGWKVCKNDAIWPLCPSLQLGTMTE